MNNMYCDLLYICILNENESVVTFCFCIIVWIRDLTTPLRHVTEPNTGCAAAVPPRCRLYAASVAHYPASHPLGDTVYWASQYLSETLLRLTQPLLHVNGNNTGCAASVLSLTSGTLPCFAPPLWHVTKPHTVSLTRYWASYRLCDY